MTAVKLIQEFPKQNMQLQKAQLVFLFSIIAGFLFSTTSHAFTVSPQAKNVIVTCKENRGSIADINRRIAANELAHYLKRITGIEISVRDTISKEETAESNVIFVGPSEYTDQLRLGRDRYDFGAGGFMIKSEADKLALLGHDTNCGSVIGVRMFGETGTYYAVTTFLEGFCGVKWLWPGPGGTVIPKQKTIKVPNIVQRSRPAYLVRYNTPYGSCHNHQPNKQTQYNKGPRFHDWSSFQRRHGMGRSIFGTVGHFGPVLKPEDFKEHPNHFSWYNGKRQPWHGRVWEKTTLYDTHGQVCQSNSAVVDFFAKHFLARGETVKGGFVKNIYFSLTPNDGWSFCLCEECKQMDGNIAPWTNKDKGYGVIAGKTYNEQIGGVSDLSNRIWTFNNKVARKVAQENPSLLLACLAYASYTKPPENVFYIEDNLMPFVVDTKCFNQETSQFEEGKKSFLGWAKKARHLGVRSYYFSFASRPHRMVETIRFLSNANYIMHRAETAQTWGFNWIQRVALLKSLYNPMLDVDKLIRDYYNAAYGPAAEPMMKYLALQEQVSMRYNIYASFGAHALVTKNWSRQVRRKLRRHLDDALKLTADTECEPRARFTEESWEMLDSYCELATELEKLKAMGFPVPYFEQIANCDSPQEETKSTISRAAQQWKRLKTVMKTVEAKKGWSVPWFSHYVQASNREGKVIYTWGKLIDNLYEQVLMNGGIALPAIWSFEIDPKEIGRKEGWFNVARNIDEWQKLRTDSTWEKQGYGRKAYPENESSGYNGKAWYRTTVRIRSDRNGRKAWIEIGAVDESCTVWFNGKEVGAFDYWIQNDRSSWQKPKRFEITDAIEYGKENTIAIEVEDKSGSGGIWKPCFILFEPLNKKLKALETGSFEDGNLQPWSIKGQGEHSASIETEEGNNHLHVIIEKESHLSLNHPQLRRHALPLDQGEDYRFQFRLRGQEDTYSRHQPPVQIRVSYCPDAVNTSNETVHFDWFRYRPTNEWQTKYIMLRSPDTNRWKNAVITFFFSRSGRYDIDDVQIESW